MAQTNYTPIYLYNSGTASNVPLAANLGAGELAINYADGKLFYKDGSSAIQVIGWKTTPTTAGGTGLTSYTAGDLPYYASGSALSKLGIGTANYVLTSSGTAPQYVAQSTLSVGSATNATNTAITDNTSSSATWYPTIVSATTGNLPQTTSSTKLSFVPSTGTLTATNHAGAWAGNTITVPYGGTGLTSLTTGQIPYGNGTSAFSSSSNLYFNGTDLYIGGSASGSGVSIYQPNGNATGSPFSVAYSSSNNSGYQFMAMYYTNGVNQYQYYVDWSGTIHARTIVISSLSDQRLKTNIRDIATGLAEINALQPRNFDWIPGQGKTNASGFIAQEFQKIFPNSVAPFKAGGDGIEYLEMNHEELIPSMVKAIQELSAQITNLETRLKNANIA